MYSIESSGDKRKKWFSGKEYAYQLLLSVLSIAMIVLGIFSPFFTVLAFILNAMYFFFTSTEKIFYQLFFFLPFAAIFKMGAGSTSMFTYLELVAMLIIVMRIKKINLTFLLLWFVFIIYLVFGFSGQYNILIKQAVIPILFYGFLMLCRPEITRFIMHYATGLVLSSIIALFGEKIPNLDNYIMYVNAYELSGDVKRFSALYYDPNYYSLNLIMAIVLITILFAYNKISIMSFIIYVGTLAYFGSQTVSKTFFLMLCVVFVFFIYKLFANGKYAWGMLSIFSIVFIIVMLFNGKAGIFDNVFDRLAEGLQSGDLSTNRTNIWNNYLNYLRDIPTRIIFGSGVGAKYVGNVAAHNTYIDFIYYYGILGSYIYISLLVIAYKTTIQGKMRSNIIPMLCLLGMFMALSCLMYFDFIFCLILAVYVLRYDFNKQ